MKDPRQRGEGRLGLFITLVVAGVAVFLAAKFVPAKVDAYQFRETLREEAKYLSVHRDDSQAMFRILEQAAEMEIPLDPKQVNIRRTKAEVIVKARYELPLDLKVTTYTFKFDEELRAPLF